MKCKHCNEEKHIKSEFCCLGCKFAYDFINSLNLENYYQLCKSIYNVSPMKVYEVTNELDYISYVKTQENEFSIHLIVEGMHCGSCIWLIENTLKKQVGVKNARVNMSTKRLEIVWSDQQERINELVHTIEKLGYRLIPFSPEASENENLRYEKFLLKCIFISGLATISIMMISVGIWIGNFNGEIGKYMRMMLHIIAAMIALPTVLYAGEPFFKSALTALKAKRSNMDIPISIGILTALFISIVETFAGKEYTYFDASVTLLFFLLIGRYLDLKVRNLAMQRAQNLIFSQARSVTIEEKGKLKLVAINSAKQGDVAFVVMGEKIPIDGVILEGDTQIDNSLISGETLPIVKQKGDYVNAGTINLGNPIRITIDKIGDSTLLGEIIKLMENAEQGKSKYVQFSDRIAGYFTPIILLLSLLTFSIWLVEADLLTASIHAISVLIITCPCALGLAIPVVQVVASSKLMNEGVLIKTADALEKLAAIDSVIFDKTGTLTHGKLTPQNLTDFSATELKLIASLASHSNHPMAKALSKLHSGTLIPLTVKEHQGLGLEAAAKGETVRIGSKKFCDATQTNNDALSEIWFKQGKTLKRMVFSDQLREDAKLVADYFSQGQHMPCVILSGDKPAVVSDVAKEVGIADYKAEINPKQKYEFVAKLLKKGQKPLMVGDGLNDSAALKAAYISISPASGLEISQTASDIVFQGSGLDAVQHAHIIALAAQKIVKQNLWLSGAYNLITVPIAMLGFASPIIAAVGMSLSSIIVVLNSLRLNYTKY